jgi:hypothetical protein
MPFESTRSWPSFELAVIAIGLAPALVADDGAVVAEVGDDDSVLAPEEPHAARDKAAAAASATAPPNRILRVACRTDITLLMTFSSTS